MLVCLQATYLPPEFPVSHQNTRVKLRQAWHPFIPFTLVVKLKLHVFHRVLCFHFLLRESSHRFHFHLDFLLSLCLEFLFAFLLRLHLLLSPYILLVLFLFWLSYLEFLHLLFLLSLHFLLTFFFETIPLSSFVLSFNLIIAHFLVNAGVSYFPSVLITDLCNKVSFMLSSSILPFICLSLCVAIFSNS